MTWKKMHLLAALLLVLGISLGVAACGDTWQGLKEDTKENAQAVKRAF